MNARAITATPASASDGLVEIAVLCYGELKGFFCHRVRCRHQAEDLTQETFRRFLGRASKSGVSHARGLLFHIARNPLIDRSRSMARPGRQHVALEEVGDQLVEREAAPDRALQDRERLEFGRQVIASLPERCREVFILSRFGGLSYQEIAERLQISTSTVEKHMIRAIRVCKAAARSRRP